MPITDWPEDERPRERLLKEGAGVLSDAELLAIFLRTGIAGVSAVDLARQLLTQFDGLAGLFSASRDQLKQVKGMGDAKYAQLQAVLEMAQRAIASSLRDQPVMDSPEKVKTYLQLELRHKPHEVFMALWLDNQLKLIASQTLFTGSLTHTHVHPREVVKAGLAHNAAHVILAHNHPSGNATPSSSDQNITQTLKTALALVDIKLVDHVIVAGPQSISMSQSGLL